MQQRLQQLLVFNAILLKLQQRHDVISYAPKRAVVEPFPLKAFFANGTVYRKRQELEKKGNDGLLITRRGKN